MLSRLAAPFRDFGFAAGLVYVVGRLLQSISPGLGLYFYELIAQPVDGQSITVRGGVALTMRELHRGDPEIALMPARTDIKESRFSQGALCIGAYRGEKFIGFIWFAFNGYEEDEVRCTYLPSPSGKAVFDFDLYIFPEYRMGRSFSNIWNGANEFLSSRGVSYTCSRITRFNVASRNAHARLGALRVGRAIFLQAWSVEFMIATIAPYIHFGVSPRNRVLIKIETVHLDATDNARQLR